MRILRPTDPDYAESLAALDRRHAAEPACAATVSEILQAVREQGDRAIIEYTARFDGVRLTPARLKVAPREIAAARGRVPADVAAALRASHANVLAFAKRGLRKDWKTRNRQGVVVGERFAPFPRVGIYIPGGTAPLISTAIMTCTLARAAGVPEIVAVTPPGPKGTINPALLFALELAGATEIYRMGGAQAIGALAYGTATVRPVTKIFGPGNAYVVEAKRQVFGHVAVDLLPGPSEVVVLADASAKPAWVAADLLAQAEHGKGSLALLFTDSAKLLSAVREQLEAQAAKLSRAAHLRPVLDHGTTLALFRSMAAAIAATNAFAPEHASLAVRQPEKLAARITTAGAIFLGHWSPVAGGDFAAGPSHELPTGGAGKSFAGLTADQFQRRTSVVQFGRESLARTLPIIGPIARMEGLDAHARSAAIRR